LNNDLFNSQKGNPNTADRNVLGSLGNSEDGPDRSADKGPNWRARLWSVEVAGRYAAREAWVRPASLGWVRKHSELLKSISSANVSFFYCTYQSTIISVKLSEPSETPSSRVFETGRSRIFGAVSLALFCGGGFAATSLFNVSRRGLEHLPAIHSLRLDGAIPLVSGWVWIYLLYYPFCFLPLLLQDVRNDPSTFKKTITAFGLQFGISFVVFLLWPLRMAHPVLPHTFNGAILHQLYAVDRGFSSFPSLHVANIMFVSLLFLRFQRARPAVVVCGIALLIAASTLLVKQHFLSDVLVGAFLGWASFAITFGARSSHSNLT